jgi:hypothetical protein
MRKMASNNRLMPYSTSLFNPVMGANDAGGGLKLSYPSWMTDNAARGIGNTFTPDYAAPVDTSSQAVAPYGGAVDAPAMDAPAMPAPAPFNPSQGVDEGNGGYGANPVSGGYGADPVSGGGGVGAGSGMGADASMQGAPNFKGGILTKNKLVGDDPDGPDDGYASVQSGEGVLTRKALKHYGAGIVNKLNKLQVDRAKLR